MIVMDKIRHTTLYRPEWIWCKADLSQIGQGRKAVPGHGSLNLMGSKPVKPI